VKHETGLVVKGKYAEGEEEAGRGGAERCGPGGLATRNVNTSEGKEGEKE